MNEPLRLPGIRVSCPPWAQELVNWDRPCATDEDRIRLAVSCARENVMRRAGGPFGAAVFDATTGLPISVGVNLVVPLNNSMLHAEVVALMLAQARLRSYTLHATGLPECELVTSCEPCAMCVGAVLWSGVRRVVWSALREDALRSGFDEGPVFDATWQYLHERGIRSAAGVLRAEGRAVLELYRERGGTIYNP